MSNDSNHPGSWHPQDEPGPARPTEQVIERGHERESVGIRGIVITAVVFGGFLLFVHLLMLNTFDFLDRTHRPTETAAPAPGTIQIVPSTAPLQPDQPADYQQMQAAEQRILNSYGWADRNAGTVRIPIDRAFDLLLQQQNGSPPLPDATSSQESQRP